MQIALTDWLREMRGNLQRGQPADLFVPLTRREQQYRQRTMTRIAPERFDDLQSIHARHVEIEQDDAEGIEGIAGVEDLERARPGVDGDGPQSPLAQNVLEQPPVGGVVVDDQDGHV